MGQPAALDGDLQITLYLLSIDATDEDAVRARIASIGLTGSNFTDPQIPASSGARISYTHGEKSKA